MELQPSVHIQHINHHGIHGLTSQSGQHHSVGLLHHHQQQQQSQGPPHLNMHDEKPQKSELIFRNRMMSPCCVCVRVAHLQILLSSCFQNQIEFNFSNQNLIRIWLSSWNILAMVEAKTKKSNKIQINCDSHFNNFHTSFGKFPCQNPFFPFNQILETLKKTTATTRTTTVLSQFEKRQNPRLTRKLINDNE